MGLHRLSGFTPAVPDPAALAAFYGELGLAGDARPGSRAPTGVLRDAVDEGPFRRLASGRRRLRRRVGPDGHRRAAGRRRGRLPGSRRRCCRWWTRRAGSVRGAGGRARTGQSPPTLVVPNAPGATVRADGARRAVLGGPAPATTPRPPGDRHARPSAATRDAPDRGARLQAERRDRRGHRLPPLLARPPQRRARRVARAAAAALLVGVRRHRPRRAHRHRPAPCRPVAPRLGARAATSPGPTSTGTCADPAGSLSSSSTRTWTRSSTTRRGRPTAAPRSPSSTSPTRGGPTSRSSSSCPPDLGTLQDGWERWPS